MLIVVSVDVLYRIFFNQTFGFTQEIAFIGFVYSVFFGAVYLFRNHALISIDVVVEKLPKKIKYIANLIYSIILIVANGYLTYLSFTLTMSGFVRPTSFLGIPYAYIYFAALVSFILMTIYSIIFFIQFFNKKKDVPTVTPDKQF